MEGKENKHHHHQQQQQEDQEEIKQHPKYSKNKILITIYQEPPQQPSIPSSFKPTNPNPATSTQGYDRRTLLIAYSQQLRQLGAAAVRDQAVPKKPEWGRWKAAFAEHHGMRRRDGQRFRLWIRRVVGRLRRRPWVYEIVDEDRSTLEGSSCSCSDYKMKEWKKKLRRFLRDLICGKGMSGCC